MIKKPIAHDVPPITDLNTIPSYNFKNYLMDIFSCISSPLFFSLPCGLFLYMLQQIIMRKDSCCLCKHDHPFSCAFPAVICFRVLPLFKRERCAKMRHFKGRASCYVSPLFVQLASPTENYCL